MQIAIAPQPPVTHVSIVRNSGTKLTHMTTHDFSLDGGGAHRLNAWLLGMTLPVRWKAEDWSAGRAATVSEALRQAIDGSKFWEAPNQGGRPPYGRPDTTSLTVEYGGEARTMHAPNDAMPKPMQAVYDAVVAATNALGSPDV